MQGNQVEGINTNEAPELGACCAVGGVGGGRGFLEGGIGGCGGGWEFWRGGCSGGVWGSAGG